MSLWRLRYYGLRCPTALRDSAAKMAKMTIKEADEGLDPPFTPGIKSVKHGNDESAETFTDRLLSESA